ncbi:MAG: GTPase domain-containing protein [Burkholderiaceae bacterium]
MSGSGAQTISLSLVSHTNAGKTTLARTLLDRDIGTIRDQAHVTDTIDAHMLAETAEGDRLLLWDTPGFGDSIRLARRLEQADGALGWLRNQVWDRVTERALWSSQQSLQHVREQSDLVLYLINASEVPEDITYLDAEMRILAWTQKPIIVLLNQLGSPQPAEQEAAEIGRWRAHLAGYPLVRSVLALDAFARCWVQEDHLLAAMVDALDAARQPSALRLRHARLAVHRSRFSRASRLLADNLAATAVDRVVLEGGGTLQTLRDIGGMVGLPMKALRDARDEAMVTLAQRWDGGLRRTTSALLELHSLAGQASIEIITRVAGHFTVNEQFSEGKAAVVGGVATGALAGLKADLATGGLTLGGGMLAGGILGALGAAGLARGINLFRGVRGITIEWSRPVLMGKVQTLALTYLAVAHFGRGRGQWVRGEYPPHWGTIVEQALQRHRQAFEQVLVRGRRYEESETVDQGSPDDVRAKARGSLTGPLASAFTTLLDDILMHLYPPVSTAATTQEKAP